MLNGIELYFGQAYIDMYCVVRYVAMHPSFRGYSIEYNID